MQMSKSESQGCGRLTVRLVKSLGQAVDTNELEWDSRVGKINSKTRTDTNELEWESRVGKINDKTSKIIRPDTIYKWVKSWED
jgi:hypothetical protein